MVNLKPVLLIVWDVSRSVISSYSLEQALEGVVAPSDWAELNVDSEVDLIGLGPTAREVSSRNQGVSAHHLVVKHETVEITTLVAPSRWVSRSYFEGIVQRVDVK